MYKANDYLVDAIEKKNLTHIRDEFTVIAHEDRPFATGKFEETLAYVKSKNIDGLVVPFDGEQFKPKEEWDKDYWAILVSSLMDNFCVERINHLKDVSRILYPSETDPVSTASANNDINKSAGSSGKAGRDALGKKTIPMATTTGMVVTCLTAIAVGMKWKSIVAVAGVTAIAAVIYAAYKK